ncbi:(d)CMP kinase [Salinicoccus roseus]|jgi:cytidylate kinase|uniref:(d)CMP kinase n=1 Tax=Salinicoccus roseus TaxID=45670 RepID=UPI000F4EEFEE|nr:(d)CMP kinase [Salinicoccus roseus]RPE54108.1 cytidylate kinase [Salinicoccus roseus]GGA68178.1 cytidylate kinase [Salinicoccus roseus]
MKKKINIAIDGPAAAGKSTISRRVAKRMAYIYIDTGAMYRAVTLHAIRNGRGVIDQLDDLDIRFGADGTSIYLNGEDVSADIRSQEVTNNVSEISSLAEVRQYLVSMQRKIAEDKGVVMDGRDIGTTVLPEAELKVYMKASPEIRAKRRLKEEKERGTDIDLETLTDQIIRRDDLDMNREISPLVKAHDAVLLDTSHMSIPEVEEKIIRMAEDLLRED